eukprot:gene22485-29611_t
MREFATLRKWMRNMVKGDKYLPRSRHGQVTSANSINQPGVYIGSTAHISSAWKRHEADYLLHAAMQLAQRGLKCFRKPYQSRSMMKTCAAAAPPDVKEAYTKLEEKLKEVSALGGISGILQWDEMVMMPEGSSACRGAQKAALAGQTDKELGELLSVLKQNDSDLDKFAKAVVRDLRNILRDYVKATAIPKDLAQRIAMLGGEGSGLGKRPVKESGLDAYDVLLDDYEKGMTSARLDVIFSQIKANTSAVDGSWLKGDFDVEKQAAMCKQVALDNGFDLGKGCLDHLFASVCSQVALDIGFDLNKGRLDQLVVSWCRQVALDIGFDLSNGREQVALDIGFDLSKGRLDVSVHPFTGGGHPTDVRMTTRFKTDDVLEGLTGAIHETGHALYEQGRNLDYDGLPVNGPMSMGIHESQSLLWERMVALGRPFSKYLLELALKTPLVSGNSPPSMLSVQDVPAVWNEKMKNYLGAEPPSAAQGALQDVHWSAGLFGYFPTYSLGAMYATQIYQHAKSQIPDLEDKIAKGEFKDLKAWLNENIHKVGSLYSSGDELMEAVTGKQLDPAIFLAYLTDKVVTDPVSSSLAQ